MKKYISILSIVFILISCAGKDSFVLQSSAGKDNKILIVTKGSIWLGDIGNEIRSYMSEPMVGLPQPEAQLSLSQVAPEGFSSMMKASRSILIIQESDAERFTVTNNKYAKPQTIVYLSAKDKEGLSAQLKKHHKEIIKIFKDADLKIVQRRFRNKRLDDSKYKTLQSLGVSLTIPKEFKTVDDTGDFLWLRQHLMSGIAKGAGSNNILVYTLPLVDESQVVENIVAMRDTIGKKHIPGSQEGMYMITEEAYTPFTFDSEIDGKKAFETRGKWEVKNDFMAGPFLNYNVIDKENNRILVFEGFTYAPSVNKREFIFELEAIAKSMKIK